VRNSAHVPGDTASAPSPGDPWPQVGSKTSPRSLDPQLPRLFPAAATGERRLSRQTGKDT